MKINTILHKTVSHKMMPYVCCSLPMRTLNRQRQGSVHNVMVFIMFIFADASYELVLSRLLENMALHTAESVTTYAQTSDARHLLLPARQLIKVPNADGDK